MPGHYKTKTKQAALKKKASVKPVKSSKPATKTAKSGRSALVPKKGVKGSTRTTSKTVQRVLVPKKTNKVKTTKPSTRSSSSSSSRSVTGTNTTFPVLWDKRFNKPYNPSTTGYILVPKKKKKK